MWSKGQIPSQELTSGIFALIPRFVVTGQGKISSPGSKKAMARIWYVRTKGAALVVWGMERKEMKQGQVTKPEMEEKRNHRVRTMWWQEGPNFSCQACCCFLHVLVCVGTWVLILNLYSGGKEVILCFKLVFRNWDSIHKRGCIKLLIRYVLFRIHFPAFHILNWLSSWFFT